MEHIFVETNWVVACAAPAHQRLATAVGLLGKAQAGELRLYLPSVCLAEAQNPIRNRYQPRGAADSIRKYLAWAMKEHQIETADCEIVRRVLDRYEAEIVRELEGLNDRLQSLCREPGIEIFPLDDEMLQRAVALSTQNLELKPFDQAILAAVLVRAERLLAAGESDLCFCELDGDLQPWDRNGRAKQPLTSLYDAAHVWVYGDFAMETPRRRANWPTV